MADIINTPIVALKTNHEFYNLKDAADSSMTVAQMIDHLSHMPQDAKVVFRNDGGYTYGYVTESRIVDMRA